MGVTYPNQVWVGDVTNVWVGHRWMYLAGVIDLFSRKSVGWAMSLSPDSRLTGKALIMAYESRHKPRGIMHHRDEDSRYTSRYYHSYYGETKLNKAYLDEEIVRIAHQ
uniref:Transposase OrfAB, subunit B n=1 Tax=Photobacterium damselae subsp. damselae TaxID=85581 RepID=E4WLK0_PHODD|nr:transposase OrfAB, subunit B [Photobacterium damselae subsp. damselae]